MGGTVDEMVSYPIPFHMALGLLFGLGFRGPELKAVRELAKGITYRQAEGFVLDVEKMQPASLDQVLSLLKKHKGCSSLLQ
jgi:hypothetical protein